MFAVLIQLCREALIDSFASVSCFLYNTGFQEQSQMENELEEQKEFTENQL